MNFRKWYINGRFPTHSFNLYGKWNNLMYALTKFTTPIKIKPMKIFKYPFEVKDNFTIEMPEDADILTVQNQREVGTMWVLCNPDTKKVKRQFMVVGTGHDFNPEKSFEYIGTYQEKAGALVWHLFEIL